jgi:hypothetical protein
MIVGRPRDLRRGLDEPKLLGVPLGLPSSTPDVEHEGDRDNDDQRRRGGGEEVEQSLHVHFRYREHSG